MPLLQFTSLPEFLAAVAVFISALAIFLAAFAVWG